MTRYRVSNLTGALLFCSIPELSGALCFLCSFCPFLFAMRHHGRCVAGRPSNRRGAGPATESGGVGGFRYRCHGAVSARLVLYEQLTVVGVLPCYRYSGTVRLALFLIVQVVAKGSSSCFYKFRNRFSSSPLRSVVLLYRVGSGRDQETVKSSMMLHLIIDITLLIRPWKNDSTSRQLIMTLGCLRRSHILLCLLCDIP